MRTDVHSGGKKNKVTKAVLFALIAISSLQQLISMVTLDTEMRLLLCQEKLDQAKKKVVKSDTAQTLKGPVASP